MPTETEADDRLPANGPWLPALEIRMGDYTWGRYAWELVNIQIPNEPIPLTGRQGLFEVPNELLEKYEFKPLRPTERNTK